tara:strand:+ start:158 stop:385 length:228 start_codon:yes stop_codon:yes gene_type:complete
MNDFSNFEKRIARYKLSHDFHRENIRRSCLDKKNINNTYLERRRLIRMEREEEEKNQLTYRLWCKQENRKPYWEK